MNPLHPVEIEREGRYAERAELTPDLGRFFRAPPGFERGVLPQGHVDELIERPRRLREFEHRRQLEVLAHGETELLEYPDAGCGE